MQTMKFTRRLRALVLAGAVAAATAGAVATPALADDWHGHDAWHGQDWHAHAWRGDDDDDWGRPAYYSYGYAYPYAYAAPAPYYGYAPAPVYAPPPAVGLYFGFR
jgi:hypothetical protein